jgi:hypothetical protein
MRVCLVCTEIAWGKSGGFGRATRTIGRELAKRGVRMLAVVPRRGEQRPVEELYGITVLVFPSANPLRALKLFRETNADILHSSEPSLGTHPAQQSVPDRLHAITFRDPRDRRDGTAHSRRQGGSCFRRGHLPLRSQAHMGMPAEPSRMTKARCSPINTRMARQVAAVPLFSRRAQAHASVRRKYLARVCDPERLLGVRDVHRPAGPRPGGAAVICGYHHRDRRARPATGTIHRSVADQFNWTT